MKSAINATLILFTLLQCMSVSTMGQQPQGNCAIQLIKKSIAAMGGDSLLHSINIVSYEGYGYRNMVEQSERFEGPYIPDAFSLTGILDLSSRRIWEKKEMKLFDNTFECVVDSDVLAVKVGDRFVPYFQDQLIQDDANLNPISILYLALQSRDLKCLQDSIINLQNNKRIHFTWKQYPVIVIINEATNLITAIQVTKPYNENFLNVWGDVKRTIFYSFWQLFDNGLHFPLQKDVYFNNFYYGATLLKKVEVNHLKETDSLKIPEAIRTASLNYNRSVIRNGQMMIQTAREIKPGIWLIPGFCNTTVIKQDDGLLIFEAPFSSSFTKRVLEKIRAIYPGEKIKTIITTSDAWLHFGGLRTYAANGIEITGWQRNKTAISSLLNAHYISDPDSLEMKKKVKPKVNYISGRTTIGVGKNRVDVIPFNTETGERMMMIYLPEQKIAYASDLYQPKGPDGKYWELHYIYEVYETIKREKLDVEELYSMHGSLVNYNDILKVLGFAK